MTKIVRLLLYVLLLSTTARAVDVSFAWDLNAAGTTTTNTTTGYFLYILTPSDVLVQKIDVGNVNTNLVTGLSANTSYKAFCTAYNVFDEESGRSNVVLFDTTPRASVALPRRKAVLIQ